MGSAVSNSVVPLGEDHFSTRVQYNRGDVVGSAVSNSVVPLGEDHFSTRVQYNRGDGMWLGQGEG